MPELDRRTFSKSVIGLLAAALTGAVGHMVVGDNAAFVEAERFWLRPARFTGFRQTYDALLWHGELLVQRSDGTRFHVTVVIPVEDYEAKSLDERADYLEATMANAHLTLDTFKDCACQVGAECLEHRRMYGRA
jgi:hypothetical protein